MSSKKIIQKFYKSDAIVNPATLVGFLHQDVVVEWHSSKGFVKLKFDDLVNLATEMSTAYAASFVKISNIISEKKTVSVQYKHFISTIENPDEEILLANFMIVWKIKGDKLYRGYQMSHIF